MQPMYYIGLDVHKRKISYCVKDCSSVIQVEGTIPAIRLDLGRWTLRGGFLRRSHWGLPSNTIKASASVPRQLK
jgi:hypothetical protein